jgi:hypothetical protein
LRRNDGFDQDGENLDAMLFDFEAFAMFKWTFPDFSSASPNLDLGNIHALAFDDFDRS